MIRPLLIAGALSAVLSLATVPASAYTERPDVDPQGPSQPAQAPVSSDTPTNVDTSTGDAGDGDRPAVPNTVPRDYTAAERACWDELQATGVDVQDPDADPCTVTEAPGWDEPPVSVGTDG